MKRYQATGTVTINVYAENVEQAQSAVETLAREINNHTGAHISLAVHHQTRQTIVALVTQPPRFPQKDDADYYGPGNNDYNDENFDGYKDGPECD